MSGDLERRYERVLRLYPATYRRERGPELLATLLDSAAEGNGRPSMRELRALLLGALRAYVGQERRTILGSWLTASRVAALMLLISAIATAPVRVAVDLAAGAPTTWWLIRPDLPSLAALPVGLFALVATLRGRYRSAMVAAGFAFAVALSLLPGHSSLGASWAYLPAVVLLLPLVRTAPRPAAGVLKYLPLVPLVLLAVDQLTAHGLPHQAYLAVTVALGVGALLWAVVDERVTMALGLWFLIGFLSQVVYVPISVAELGGLPLSPAAFAFQLATAALAPALLLAVSATAVRRQLRL